jgi:hypothetical protein
MKQIFSGPVDRSLAELRRLQGIRTQLDNDQRADSERLAVLRASLPDAECASLLEEDNGAAAKQLRNGIADLEKTIAGRSVAKPQLLARIRQAIATLGAARAAIPRTAVKKLQGELDTHMAEVCRMRAELEKFTGAKWVVDERDVVPPHVLFFTEGEFGFAPPKSMRMEGEISRLESAIRKLEEESQYQDGSAVAESLEALLLLTNDLEKLAPAQPEVEAWFAIQKERADKAWNAHLQDIEDSKYMGERFRAPERGLAISLIWGKDGEILPASNIQNRTLNAIGRTVESPSPDVREAA